MSNGNVEPAPGAPAPGAPAPGAPDTPELAKPLKVGHLSLSMPAYFLLLVGAVVIQSLWVPTWFISSRSGLQTVVQILPAALIALFALAFATLFVAVQQVTNVFSSRAPVILANDIRVRRIVARTVLIAAASLCLGGIIPDPPKPLPAYMTAVGTTLLIASAWLIYSYGRFSYLLIIDYSSPRSFVRHVVSPVLDMINRNKVVTGFVVFRVPLLGQTLRYALRRDDAENLYASLDGLLALQEVYVQATVKDPRLRNHQLTPTSVRENWLSDELYRIYTAACEEALRLHTPQHEIDHIVDSFAAATRTFIAARQEPESIRMMAGLVQLAASPYQVMPNVTNYLTRPASTLATAENLAEQNGQTQLATMALADWAVAIAYPQVHFGHTYHPLFEEGVHSFGNHPPWNDAIELIRNPLWNIQWVNQLQYRIDFPTNVIELARDLHEGVTGANYQTRKESVYRDWLDITENIASEMVMNGIGFMQRLEGINQNIFMFGSPEVQAAVRGYFNSFGNFDQIMRSLPGAATPAQADEVIRDFSAFLEQRGIAQARADVITAMTEDLGEDPSTNTSQADTRSRAGERRSRSNAARRPRRGGRRSDN